MRGAIFSIILLGITLIVNGVNIKKDTINDTAILKLTSEEQLWLKQHPVIKYGSDPQWAPFEFKDRKNTPSGLTRDYISIIEQKLGVEFEYIKCNTWDEIYNKAKNKEVDFLSAAVQSDTRSKYFLFTEPYNFQPVSVYAQKGSNFIRNLNELNGKKVGVVKGYFIESLLKKDYPEIYITSTKNIETGLKKLSKNEIDAFIESMPVVNYYINSYHYENIRIVGVTPYLYSVSISVRRDWPIFRNILQKTLNSIPKSEKKAIYDNWISYRDYKNDYSLLFTILIPLLIILIVSIFWNSKLSKEVKKRKKAQKELDTAFKKLKDTQAHLVQTEKLATIGMLTAGIAHEIKNPVNYISGSISLVEDNIESIIQYTDKVNELMSFLHEEKKKELERIRENIDYEHIKSNFHFLFESIKKGSEQIIEIANGFNSFSIKANTEKQKYNINRAIKSTLVLLRNQYKYNIELTTDLAEIPEIECYAGKINQVFLNILTNAIQAIEKNGEIHIQTYVEENHVKVSIKDNGSGISKESIEKIFNPFYTTKSIEKGTGLGLAISKNIIDDHNGTIKVNSEPKVGTEFIVSLPLK